MTRWLAIVSVFTLGATVHADAPPFNPTLAAGITQQLGAQVPADLAFTDEAGKAVHFGDYLGRQPVVLALVYHRCPRLCSLTLTGLLDALRGMTLDAGKDFQLVVVSFDPGETPASASAARMTFLERYPRRDAASGVHFLTGAADATAALAAAIGFRYQFDPALDQYAHASGIMVLTPTGKVARYFFGVSYPASDLRLSLVEASAGTVGTAIDQVMLLCFAYDPSRGRYTATALGVLRISGVLTVLALGSFLAWSWRRERAGTGPEVGRV